MRSAQPPPPRIHRAARTEDVVRALLNRWLLRRGWRPQVLPFAGYGSAAGTDGGTDGWVRLLRRGPLTPAGASRLPPRGGAPRRNPAAVRGWRRFLSAPAPGVPVTVDVGGRRHEVASGRD